MLKNVYLMRSIDFQAVEFKRSFGESSECEKKKNWTKFFFLKLWFRSTSRWLWSSECWAFFCCHCWSALPWVHHTIPPIRNLRPFFRRPVHLSHFIRERSKEFRMAFLGHHTVTAASTPIVIRPLSRSKTVLPMDIDSMERDDSILTRKQKNPATPQN